MNKRFFIGFLVITVVLQVISFLVAFAFGFACSDYYLPYAENGRCDWVVPYWSPILISPIITLSVVFLKTKKWKYVLLFLLALVVADAAAWGIFVLYANYYWM